MTLPSPPHYLPFRQLCSAEAFVTNTTVSLSSLQHGKAPCRLALCTGACQPRTVIIPELTSPLSIELLRRWRGHKIPCSGRQQCSSCPSAFKKENSKCTKNAPPAYINTTQHSHFKCIRYEAGVFRAKLRNVDRFHLSAQASLYVCKTSRIECQPPCFTPLRQPETTEA